MKQTIESDSHLESFRDVCMKHTIESDSHLESMREVCMEHKQLRVTLIWRASERCVWNINN